MARGPVRPGGKSVETLTHDEAARRNIPTAELQSFLEAEEAARAPLQAAYPRARPLPRGEVRERDEDLDPQIVWNGARIWLTKEQVQQLNETGEVSIGDAQLVWRGKDQQDWSDLIVQAPPLYIQEKIHPKAIIDDLKRAAGRAAEEDAPNLFAEFNGLDPEARTEFYAHDQHWSNRLILGDSLQVMASLAEREGLKGKVQCIYFDPPYGIKFSSNWQVSTQSTQVKDNRQADITREPEQVKAFRDTWKDGIHSYLTYLRDRLTVGRELLTESGSIFVQIGDENVHRVRALMDEIFGEKNFGNLIAIKKTGSTPITESAFDYLLWFFKNREQAKIRRLYRDRKAVEVDPKFNTLLDSANFPVRATDLTEETIATLVERGADWARVNYPIVSQDFDPEGSRDYWFQGGFRQCGNNRHWTFEHPVGLDRLKKAERLYYGGGKSIGGVVKHSDRPAVSISNLWDDVKGEENAVYVVQTAWKVVQRCLLMTTDPGDLVFDPTCGSGTTAFVAEQWGRRWITTDTSRVALALARTRLMSARYPYYLLADSPDGRTKEQRVSGRSQPLGPSHGDIRQGFVHDRGPNITLKSIANNDEIDLIWERFQATLEPLRAEFNAALGKAREEWEIPREADAAWPEAAKAAHAKWWEARIARQREIDASIARRADVELLYDRPYADNSKIRVAGPFTVESLSPHRVIPSDADTAFEEIEADEGRRARSATPPQDFAAMVLENLKVAGVQGRDKADKVRFSALEPWPGKFIGAEGRYREGVDDEGPERRAAILIGPEFGTLARPDLVAAAREAADTGFDVLIACAFAYDAHASELTRLGPLPILQAKMNPDLHMADDLKTTPKANLFVVFGEPDIDVRRLGGDRLQVKVNGVDVFDPNTGEVRSNDVKGIAAWFIDTDYDEESFFVRHAYFLGANDPYKSLKVALKAEIDEASWASLYRDESRPFPRPKGGRIAVKVINHFGDEVMKVVRV